MPVLQFRVSDFIEKFFYLNGRPFSLDDYPHMKLIYNVDPPEMTFCTSRQVAKCGKNSSLQHLANGSRKFVSDLKIGDELISFDEETQKTVVNKIKALEPNGNKIIYKIITRTGHIAEVTAEHPFWTLNPSWTEAKDLQIGDMIGLACTTECSLPITKTIPDEHYIILAHLLAEGGLSTNSVGYTNNEMVNVQELNRAIKFIDTNLFVKSKGKKYPGQYTITTKRHTNKIHSNKLLNWLRVLGLMGCKSATKFHPPFIFELTKEQIADYLRIWWNTDGYISNINRSSLPDIGIALISEQLIDGIQQLLLKLGIHTCKSIQDPPIYKNTDKRVYKLRVEGANSVERFYQLINTRKLKPYSKKNQNNNRLVVPRKGLQKHFDELKDEYLHQTHNPRHCKGYQNWALQYDITYTKLKSVIDSLPEKDEYLETIYSADIIYDRITNIEILPAEATTNIEMEAPYNTFLIDGLVTHNSTTLSNLGLGKMLIMPQTRIEFSGGFKVLYIAPTVEQVKVFSHERVAPVIMGTPFIKKHFINSSIIQNVFLKKFINGSSMFFRYAAASADKARGLSVDMLLVDETQDIPDDNISIIEQTMARSLYKRKIYAGTPKRTIGSLAKRWDASTRNEWFVLCTSCDRWNYLDEQNIKQSGLVCRFCEKPIDARNGQWIRTNSDSIKSDTTGQYLHEGFRVSVLMFAHAPWVDWQKDVWIPFQTKPKGLFLNEYLGLPYDAGVQPITEEEIKACCTGGPMKKNPDVYTTSYPCFLGIDWGPINSENSRTVMSVLQKRGEQVEVIYMKRFVGAESDYSYLHDEIPRQYIKWKIQMIGADAGFGEAVNSEVRRRINDPRRLLAFQHLGNQKQKANWNGNMQAYTLGRNKVMTELFQMVKNKKIIFPQWSDFEPFARDMLAIQIDYDEEKNKYKFINSHPDDSFHSILYGNLAADLWHITQGEE